MSTTLDSDRSTVAARLRADRVVARPRTSAPRQTAINIRVNERQISLIDQAAETLGQTRSAFMLERSVQAAETVLLDQCFFAVDDKTYEAFKSALEKPVAINPKLAALLRKPAPWDR